MTKKMRRAVSVCMVLLMAAMITACGNDDAPAASESPETATEAPATEEPEQEAQQTESETAEEPAADEGTASGGLKLVGGEKLLEGTKNIESDQSDDGSYYFSQDATEDGMLTVYQEGGVNIPGEDVTEEEYALNLATGLSATGANDDARVKPANEYSENTSYPVYVASFTSGSNEDTSEWWVFVTYTDSGVYLYGITTPVDAEVTAGDLANQTFPNLRIG